MTCVIGLCTHPKTFARQKAIMMRIPENPGNTWSIVPDSLAQSVATQGTKRNAHAMRLGTSDARLSPMQPVPESFLDRLVPSPDRQVPPSMSLVQPQPSSTPPHAAVPNCSSSSEAHDTCQSPSPSKLRYVKCHHLCNLCRSSPCLAPPLLPGPSIVPA